MIEQINQLKQGSIISESSHYIVNRVSGSNAWLTHFESGEEVQIRKVLQMQQRILLLSWLITLYFLMRKVKIEFLEAIRFNLNQEMADMIV
jgi:hypothetical protein